MCLCVDASFQAMLCRECSAGGRPCIKQVLMILLVAWQLSCESIIFSSCTSAAVLQGLSLVPGSVCECQLVTQVLATLLKHKKADFKEASGVPDKDPYWKALDQRLSRFSDQLRQGKRTTDFLVVVCKKVPLPCFSSKQACPHCV